MEFPHHHHHHHKRDDEDTNDYPPPGSNFSSFHNPPPPPPPSFFAGDEPPPSRPYSTQVYHTSHTSSEPPPPPRFQSDALDYNYPSSGAPPPPPRVPAYAPPPDSTAATVHHVSHEVDSYETHHAHRPHMPSFVHHHSHEESSDDSYGSNKRTVRVFPKAAPNFSLTIRNGNVILAPSDPSDGYQHWYKDEKYSTRVKDEEGFPAFSLVNKVTGEAIKHSIGATHPVRLVPYKSDYLDESVLWSESKDMGDGYRAVRMVNNIHLNVDAFHGDKKSGGVHDGTTIVLWKWNKGDNQLWRIVPYCKFLFEKDSGTSSFYAFYLPHNFEI
ncbi:ricin B-like lectin R40G3 [Senna tora]|uniref:Ricin B-like lectin R40G3 n=1 Tax=Senna tora TaxID=362788 RepID=A0A834SDX5_9FABA|nr:ricin B-like lectin R40G3 [Senna tora]